MFLKIPGFFYGFFSAGNDDVLTVRFPSCIDSNPLSDTFHGIAGQGRQVEEMTAGIYQFITYPACKGFSYTRPGTETQDPVRLDLIYQKIHKSTESFPVLFSVYFFYRIRLILRQDPVYFR